MVGASMAISAMLPDMIFLQKNVFHHLGGTFSPGALCESIGRWYWDTLV